MFPFYSRISTVPNAPLRVRFVLPSSSISNTYGRLILTYSQFGFTTSHLCHIIVYMNYTTMMQQTERNVYKAICSSGSNTLTVTPPPLLTLSSGVYY
jgi:hypothetical protein